jgi:protein-disulfide isomerase
VEYGDYQCPYCRRAHPIFQQLAREFPTQVRLVFRHFPVFAIHPRAENAAEAAEAAAAQGKFWEMHHQLFENQHALDVEDLIGYAAALGLDRNRFEAELLDRRYVDRIHRSRDSGVRSGVIGTPTFFVNGIYYGGAHELEPLRAAILAAAGHQ